MKANQAFQASDDAVSPVIGVILMVAITVVLAAVVFVLVSNLSKTSNNAPQISFSADDTNRKLTVVSGPAPAINWSSITIGGTCSSTFKLNGGTAGTTTGTVKGGDVITACTTGQTISFTHTATNTLLYTHTFP
jgi:flagellin-like protein